MMVPCLSFFDRELLGLDLRVGAYWGIPCSYSWEGGLGVSMPMDPASQDGWGDSLHPRCVYASMSWEGRM